MEHFKGIRLFILASLMCLTVNAMAAKPGASMKAQLEWVSPLVMGSVNEMKLTVRAAVPTKSLQLQFVLPKNIQLLDTALVSTIQLDDKNSYTHIYRIDVAENAVGNIEAIVSAGTPGKAYFSAVTKLLVGESGAANALKAREQSELPYRKVIRNGLPVREYILD